ncbi:MAG: SgcJ/EcaC family oxidoreductase [Acidobacteria bacterium]|nr:SgcJ/EcaC family oxidoreductase [Acidobacteriota bacterium]
MKRIATILIGLFLIFVAASLAPAQVKDDPGVAKVRTAYQAAVIAKDAKAIAALYAEDGVEMPPNGPSAKGRAAIEKFNQGLFDQFNPKLAITPSDTKVSGDWAFDVGSYTQTLTPVKGGAPIKDTGKYVVVLKRAGGQWWAAYAIYDSDLPPMPPPAPVKK